MLEDSILSDTLQISLGLNSISPPCSITGRQSLHYLECKWFLESGKGAHITSLTSFDLWKSHGHIWLSDFKGEGKCNLIVCFDEEEPGYLWTGLMTTRGAFLREPVMLRYWIEILMEHVNAYPRNINYAKAWGTLLKANFNALENHNLTISLKMQLSWQ